MVNSHTKTPKRSSHIEDILCKIISLVDQENFGTKTLESDC